MFGLGAVFTFTIGASERRSLTGGQFYLLKIKFICPMTNHRLSVEQKVQLEGTFHQIDSCQDIHQLRQLAKQIITAQENEKAFAIEAIVKIRREFEATAINRLGVTQ